MPAIFDLYHRAITNFGANTTKIDRLLSLIRKGHSVDDAVQASEAGEPVQRFVGHTFEIIDSNDLCRIASAFTFGREDLLPDVFQKIVDQIDRETQGGLTEFKYYLKRHIDLDADEHGPMATRLVSDLCGDDPAKWNAARDAAVSPSNARTTFWDSIQRSLLENT